MHVSCIHVRAWWGRKREKIKNGFVFKSFLNVSRGPGASQECKGRAEKYHSRVTLEPLWGHFGHIRVTLGHFMITLGSLWNHFGYMRVDFQKTFIFPIDFNDFIKHWGSFGFALGLLGGHFWHMKVTFGAFRGHFEVTLSMSTSNFMCDACVMHTCTGLVGPKK